MPERRPTGENGEPATAAILALEKDLERERKRAAKSLEQVQRRLERAETGGAATATVTDTRVEAAELMLTEREVPTEAPREAEARDREPGAGERRLSTEPSQREQALTLEREAARRAAADARARFDEIAAQVEAASAEVERIRERADAATAAAVERVKAETEARMRSEAEARLETQATELKADAEERVRAAAESVRAETEKRHRAEIEALRSELAHLEQGADKPRRFSLRRRRQKGPSDGERGAAEPTPATAPGTDTETRMRPLVNLNDATFEQLRALDMSVTQATRVIAYRERQDGFDSVDDLGSVPGFPKPFLEQLKQQLSS